MIQAFWATYAAVLAAEIVGDKFFYTTDILATRYRTAPMVFGIAIAFMAKMGIAVAIGDIIANLPRVLIALVTAAGAVWIGTKFWNESEPTRESRKEHSNSEAAVVSCASVLFSEWADLGQLTAATMAAQFHAPVFVWMGAVAAMMTKAVLAVAIGAELSGWLRRRVPAYVVRYGGLTLLLLLGGLSVAETLLRGDGLGRLE
jgi:putative Ca2+/H+ antiporter (TMEM165/GDT1 family)